MVMVMVMVMVIMIVMVMVILRVINKLNNTHCTPNTENIRLNDVRITQILLITHYAHYPLYTAQYTLNATHYEGCSVFTTLQSQYTLGVYVTTSKKQPVQYGVTK